MIEMEGAWLMKRHRALPWLAAIALVISACGADAESNGGAEDPAEVEPIPGLEYVDSQLVAAAQQEGEVVWYTANAEDISIDFARGFEELTGIRVTVFQSTSAPLVETVLTEAARRDVRADVVGLTDAPAFLQLVEDGIMASFEPAGLDDYPSDSMIMAPYGYPYHVVLPSILYNTNLVTGSDVDKLDSVDALTDPAFRGMVALPDPALTGFGFNAHWLYRELVGEAEYVAFLERLRDNQPRWFSSGTNAADAIASGEMAIGWLADSQGVQANEIGAPVAVSYRPERLPAYFGLIGVTEEGPNPNAGRLFLTYMLSAAGQESWMEAYNAGSANAAAQDTRSHSQEAWFADYSPDKLFFDTDPARQAEGRDALLQTISSVFPEIGG